MQMNLEAMTWDTLPCLQQQLAIEAFSVKCFNYRGIIDMLAPTIMSTASHTGKLYYTIE